MTPIKIEITTGNQTTGKLIRPESGRWFFRNTRGIQADFFYAGILNNTAAFRDELKTATTPEQALAIVRAAQAPGFTAQLAA